MSAIYFSLASGTFSQDWSNAGLITTDNNWDGVPSIVGFRGDDITTSTGVDPQTLLGDGTVTTNVIANQTNPNTLTTGGVAEFALPNPTIALNGSGTADAPHIVLYMDATGRQNIRLQFNVRDLDGSTDNAVQPLAVQYRIGSSGLWTNLSSAFISDATTGPSLASLVTPVDVTLPSAVNGASQLQIRIITSNAAGNDEWIGIDDIQVSSAPLVVATPTVSVAATDATATEGVIGDGLTFTFTRTGDLSQALTVDYTLGGTATAGVDYTAPATQQVTFAAGSATATLNIAVLGDATVESAESVVVSVVDGAAYDLGASSSASGTIVDTPPLIDPVINEVVANHVGTDTNEYIEIFGSPTTDYSTYRVLQIEGDANSNIGTVISASVLGTTDASGIFVTPFLNNVLQNGTGTFLLVQGFTGTVGQDLDTDNDGVFEATPWGRLVDSVAFGDGGTGDVAYSSVVLGPGFGGFATSPGGASRVPNGVDTNSVADWAVNDFNLAGIPGFSGTVTPGTVLNTPGALNSLLAATPTVSVAATDATATEGAAGDGLTFTFTRTGDLSQALTVDYTLGGTATAGVDYTAPATQQITFAAGSATATLNIAVLDDATVESAETVVVTVVDGPTFDPGPSASATGTITDNDIGITRIYDIQGAGHRSALESQTVTTVGIVTGVASNGFYIQDRTGDGNFATSDGIFVFTSSAPASFVVIGNEVQVTGRVTEFLPGNTATNLTITELTSPTVSLLSTGNALPFTLLGGGGRMPPLANINDEATGALDPANFDAVNDGLDFFESLEGMRISLSGAVAVSPTNGFGEFWVVTVNDPASANLRGGVTIAPGAPGSPYGDFNPQRIQIDDGLFSGGASPQVSVGASFGTITGVVSYSFGNYELLPTAPVFVTANPLQREATTLVSDAKTLTFASFNAENLDPGDGAAKFAGLAAQIVTNLKSPTIVALQEIQDNSGATNNGVTDASITAQTLIDAIKAAGGPTYTYIDVAPANNTSGGEPGGNIRPGFLYRADVVQLVPGSVTTLDVAAFNNSRDPLIAKFVFNGETFTFINNHFSSKGGDTPLFGSSQPPVLNSETNRIPQAQVVNDYVDGLLTADPNAKIVVLGDLNDFVWSTPLRTLDGTLNGGARVLWELGEQFIADPAERYSYNFEGNSQELDHIYVSQGALAAMRGFDIVHVNAEFFDQNSDHDPSVAAAVVNRAPTASDVTVTVDETADDAVTLATVTAVDPDGDTVVYSITGGNAQGLFEIDGTTGAISLAAGKVLDRESAAEHVLTVKAADADGLFATSKVTINVADVDEFNVTAPVDADDAANTVAENAVLGAAVGITASASDADATTNVVTYSLVDNDGGRFAIDAATGVVTVAGAINRETDGANRSIIVRATSADGSAADQTFTIAVTDVNEFQVTTPVDTNNALNTVAENAAIGTLVGITASASDADATNNAVSYSLVDNDGGRFAIDAVTGVVTVAGTIDREVDGPSRSITVRASSADGSAKDTTFAIAIEDVNDFSVTAPTDGNAANNRVAEDAAIGAPVGITASALDGDATMNAVTYALVDNAGGRFAINTTTGVVTVAGALDYETATSHLIRVRATSVDGSTAETDFTIAVTDVVEFVNTPPVANADMLADPLRANGGAQVIARSLLLGNDTDADGNALSIASVSAGTGGTVALNASGNVVFTPTAGFQGQAFFTYAASDGTATSAPARVDLLVGILGTNGADGLNGTSAADYIFGLGGDDVIFARGANDVIYGGAGADIVFGGSGNDRFVATLNDGNDLYFGYAGNETYDLSGTTASATVDLGEGTATSAQTGTDRLFFVENVYGSSAGDVLFGSNAGNRLEGRGGDDQLVGRGGSDTLLGGTGADTLLGGGGADILSGGADADVFVFASKGDIGNSVGARDAILDFQLSIDRIDLREIDANTRPGFGGDQAFTFLATPGAAFTGAAQLRYNFATIGGEQVTLVQGNVDANLNADFTLELRGAHYALTAGNFLL
jgi:hypothetical protein